MLQKMVGKFNQLTIVAFITLLAVIGTQLIAKAYYSFTGLEMRHSEVIVGILAPSIIASTVSYYLVGLMKKLAFLEMEMRQIAGTDQATNLKSRRALFETGEDLFQLALRYKKNLGIILLDIDHFKQINDTYGHVRGDLILSSIGNIINTSRRGSDIAGRFGGDEIMILLPETDTKGCELFCEKLLMQIRLGKLAGPEEFINISVSAGISSLNIGSPVKSFDQLVDKADIALYEAKKQGRDRFCIQE